MPRPPYASTTVVLALGANEAGRWGEPPQTLRKTIDVLKTFAINVVSQSALFKTPPLGSHRQKNYFNQILVIETTHSPAALLRVLKRIERAAGRRPRGRWTARPLDLDIIAYKGQHYRWPYRVNDQLTLPHPEMHRRVFVLHPLRAVLPHWWHPQLAKEVRALLLALPQRDRRAMARLNARQADHDTNS